MFCSLLYRSLRTNNQMSLVVALSVVSEASILIFTFYWAPLLSSVFANSIQAPIITAAVSAPVTFSAPPVASATAAVVATAVSSDPSSVVSVATRYLLESVQTNVVTSTPIPFMLIYATFMMSTMLGRYLLRCLLFSLAAFVTLSLFYVVSSQATTYTPSRFPSTVTT